MDLRHHFMDSWIPYKSGRPCVNCRTGLAVRAKNGVGLAISFLNSSLTLRRAALKSGFTILFRNKKHNYGSQSCN